MAYVSETSGHGVRYISQGNPKRHYHYLRRMLRECWEVNNTPASEQIPVPQIDVRFSYSLDAICDYIRKNFTDACINKAHANLIANMEKRQVGRPQGARNKSKVMAIDAPTPNNNASGSVLDEFIDNKPQTDVLPPEGSVVTSDDMNDSSEDKPEAQAIDLSNYVTRPEFDRNMSSIANNFVSLDAKIERQRDDNANFFGNVIDRLDTFQAELNKRKVVTVEFKPVDRPNIDLGRQHMAFPDLLALCCAAIEDGTEPLNVWLYGPAGTGKTTAAKNISKALREAYNRPFPFYALSKLSTEFQVLGYQDAGGKYVTTLFRQCYEFGGVIILDEIDSWSPNAMTALNGALANGYCAFPDRMVDRHPDCVVIAGANTTGSGGTIEYVGRLQQDAASLDRFEMLHWPIDEALEAALTDNDVWLARVRHVRAMVAAKGIKNVMITPRAAIKGAARIRAGVSFEMAEKLFLKRGMSDVQWDMVR